MDDVCLCKLMLVFRMNFDKISSNNHSNSIYAFLFEYILRFMVIRGNRYKKRAKQMHNILCYKFIVAMPAKLGI